MKEYLCPCCNTPLNQYYGEFVHPNDPNYGITLDCGNRNCPPQQVMGHGKTAEEAYKVIRQKYCGDR